MSENTIKQKFKQEIRDLESQLTTINDGTRVLAKASKELTDIAKRIIEKVNATASIDQKISLLGIGLQETVTYLENENNVLNENVHKIKDKIEYITEFAHKVDVLIEEEKKSSTIVEEQKI
tara:strand:+ start:2512 stop:2874 length:363 start_codon:yes stop_codon:yes gene_type:complete